ncbi:Polysaccharide export system outer membrane protein [Pedobacter cryoconitis]|uniref:Polysaccharide export system outer membrane protein n=1 Tax=Pedobacter cryoconitis TaxID=188932 RepID=A0A127VJ01_9SPHI|nr:polysaccharide biosynthesis/export family protein [Pedobacter cryoconitis]AMQ01260.1 Polysaccharide export system outer membrane protein [Pedobacter cryoconitis]
MPSNKYILYAFIFILLTSCFSCSVKQQQALFENRRQAFNNTPTITDTSAYKIQPQDLLQIKNLQSPKYIVDEPTTTISAAKGANSTDGQTFLVESDGTVALPIIGRVKVEGLNRYDAAKKIENIYSKEIKNPIIDLKIVNLKVTILGEVKTQGSYTLVKDRTSLIEMIGEAGGLTERANSKNVRIIRGGIKNQEVIDLDLSNLTTLSDPRIILKNEDIIYVTQNKQAVRTTKVTGFSSILQPIILLLNTALIIYTITR